MLRELVRWQLKVAPQHLAGSPAYCDDLLRTASGADCTLFAKVVDMGKLLTYTSYINSTTKGNEMNKAQLIETIKASGKVENHDAAMHADAIIDGAYSLVDLFANAEQFYGFDGYAHETALMDTM